MKSKNKIYVIPEESGIQQFIDPYTAKSHWIPAFAGMTIKWDSSGLEPFTSYYPLSRHVFGRTKSAWSRFEWPKASLKGELQDAIRNAGPKGQNTWMYSVIQWHKTLDACRSLS